MATLVSWGTNKKKNDVLNTLSNFDVRTNNATNRSTGGFVANAVNQVNNLANQAKQNPAQVQSMVNQQRQAAPLRTLSNLNVQNTVFQPQQTKQFSPIKTVQEKVKQFNTNQNNTGRMNFNEYKATKTAQNAIGKGDFIKNTINRANILAKNTDKINAIKTTANNTLDRITGPNFSDDTNGWKQFYDEEFKKASSRQNFGQRLLDQGSASRLAEQNARNRYASELLSRAYDDNGNIKNEDFAKRAQALTNTNSNIARSYNEAEKAKSRKIGASVDSDYYTGFEWDKDKNKSHASGIGDALNSLGKQMYATANVVRNMSVGDAVLGANDTQKTDWKDVAKFAVDLVPGMLTAPIQGGTNIAEAISGKGTNTDTGRHRELNGLERLGRGASGAVDAAGVFFGGSGELLNAGAKTLFKKGATEAVKEAVKQTPKAIIKDYLKAMIEEGAEEGVQQAFEFFGDGGKLITEDGDFDKDSFNQLLQESGQAAALGAVGGGIFKGGADLINLTGNKISSNINNRAIRQNNINYDNNGNAVKTNPDGTTSRLTDSELAERAKGKVSGLVTAITDKVDDIRAGADRGFGPVYDMYSGQPKYAKDYLMRRQQGEVPNAAYNQNVEANTGNGGIDYVYGTPGDPNNNYVGGYGLAHIYAKHGDEALNRVVDNTQNGIVNKDLADRLYLGNPNNNDRTVIRKDWDGNKKQWLTTSFENDNPASRGDTSENTSSTTGSSVVSSASDAPVMSTIPQNTQNHNTSSENVNLNTQAPQSVSDILTERNPQSRLNNAQNRVTNNLTKQELKTLTERAKNGDTEAIRALEELGLTPVAEENTDWRGKSVDEVINPEETTVTFETESERNQKFDKAIKRYYEKYGEDFYEKMPEALQERYDTLIDNQPRNADGVYTDPITGGKSVDAFQSDEMLELIRDTWGNETSRNYDALNSARKLSDVTSGKTSFEDYINEQRELLWESFKDSNRGTETFYTEEDGKINGRHTISNNGTLYRQLYNEVGAKPTKAEFNAAFDDVLAKGPQSPYYDGFREFDPGGERGIFDFNQGNEGIDIILMTRSLIDTPETSQTTAETAPSGNFTVTDGIKTEETINGKIDTYTGKDNWNGAKVFHQDGNGIPVGYKLMADENAAPSDNYVAIINNQGEKALIELPHSSEYDYERVGLATGRTREALEADGLVENTGSAMTRPEWVRQTSKNTTEAKTISEVVNAGTSGGKRTFAVITRGVSKRISNIVKRAIGLDVSNYDHTIDNYAVRHTINEHQNDIIPVKESDFNLVPDIISNADSVKYNIDRKGNGAIVYTKEYGDRVVYLEEVRRKRHELATKTMYWQPAHKNSTTSSANPHPSSDTDSLRALPRRREGATGAIIPQTPNDVNNTTSRFARNTSQNQSFSTETRQALKSDPLSYTPTTNEERLARANEILATKSTNEIDNYLRDNFFDVKDKDRNSGDMVLAGELAKMLDSKGEYNRSTEIINKMSEIGTKQGQNIQAMSLMMNRSPEGIANMAQSAIKKGGGEMSGELRGEIVKNTKEIGKLRATKNNLESENAKITEQILNGKGDLPTLRKRQMEIAREYRMNMDAEGRKFAELSDIVNKNAPDNRSIFGSVYRASLLSGPRTHTGNFISNTFQNALNAGADRIASGLDWARAKLTGTEREIVGSAGGRMKGLKRGLSAAGEVMKTGNNLWDGMDATVNKVNAWGQGGELEFKNKIANTMVAKPTNFVFRAMSAGDLPFRYVAFENAIRTEAKRQGVNLGYKGQMLEDYVNSRVAAPDPELQAYGIRKGNESVYDADTLLSKAMAGVDKVIEGIDNPIGKKTAQTAKTLVAPFVKVPSKVLSTAIDYSPLGSVKAIVKKVGSKNYTTAQFETDLARSGLGTSALVGLGYALSAAGLLTGGYPDDQDERNRWKAEGIEPNSVKIGDKYLSLNYLGPASMLMSMGSGVQQRQTRGEDAWTIATGTVMDTLNTFLDQSYVQGLNNVVQAITDSQRYGESYLNSLARGITPNLFRQTATAFDPMQRQVNNPGEAVISGIPGLSQTLDAKVDTYGREIENKQTLPLGQMWDALKISNSRETNAVIDEIKRLHEVDPNNKDLQVTPTAQQGSISVDGTNVKLTDKQKTQLQKDVGQAALMAMSQVIESEDYQNLSDTEKAAALDKARKNAQKQARKQFIAANNITADNNPETTNTGGEVTGDFTNATDSSTSKNSIKISDSLAQEYKSTLEKYNSMSSEDWNDYLYGNNAESAAAEYNLARAKYENDLAAGKLTDVQKIKREKELAKLEVSKGWTKDVRDVYSLAGTKADIQALLNGLEDSTRDKMVRVLNGLNNAMYEAGVISKTTYNTRGRNINNLVASKSTGKKSGRKSSGSKSSSNKLTAAEANAISAATKALSLANDGYKVKAPEKPTTARQMNKTKLKKTSLKNYTPKKATISVTKGKKKGA